MTPARTICLGFLLVIFAGTLLLMLPTALTSGTWGNPITALFISTSAVCVTGLAVVDVGTFYTMFGQGIIALLTQIGGLGYMTATTFLLFLIGKKFSLREKVTLQQALDRPGIKGGVSLVQSIIATTLLFELTGVLVLWLTFRQNPSYTEGHSLWLAIFHSVSAFNNAGFSLFSNNLMDYVASAPVNLTITGLIIFGGIGYQVIFEIFVWLRSKLTHSREFVAFSLNFKVAVNTTILLLVGGTIAIWLTEHNNPQTLQNMPTSAQWWAAWFQSVTSRTAGFNTIDNGLIRATTLFITIALMFVGASPGGTGGGIKTTTFAILSGATKAALQGVEDVNLYNRRIPHSLIVKALGVAVGSLITVILGTVFLLLSDPKFEFAQILFEVVSAFGTVGLSTGITPKLSPWGQIILVIIMYIGRVGVLLLMGAIVGDGRKALVKHPEESLLVG
ncbi:MAG: TrkH family potassium uptake protein [Pseudanabaenaceae cyanobacterium]